MITIEDDGEKFFSLSHIDLPGLTIYSDSIEEGLDELKAAKKDGSQLLLKLNLIYLCLRIIQKHLGELHYECQKIYTKS